MSSVNTTVQEKASKAWKISKIISEGPTNIVALIQNEESSQYSVAKILAADDASLTKRFETEARIHSELDHPRVLKFEDFQKDLCLVDNEGNEGTVVAIRTEYAANGDLFDLLCNFSEMPLFLARSYARQMSEALAYLHKKGIAHRDLKLENFLLNSEFKVQLADFGYSCKTDSESKLTDLAGTYQYLAPEQLEGESYNGFEADVFSLGMAIFVLVAGRLPFEKASQDDEIYKHLFNGEEDEFWRKQEELSDYPSSQSPFSKDFKQLINGMLRYNASSRMTITEVLSHPWMNISPVAMEKSGELVREILKKKGVTL